MASKISTVKSTSLELVTKTTQTPTKTKSSFKVQQVKTSGALLARCRGQACDAIPPMWQDGTSTQEVSLTGLTVRDRYTQ